MPPRSKQSKQNRNNSTFLKIFFQVFVFTARAFYLALTWVYHISNIFLWSLSHWIPLESCSDWHNEELFFFYYYSDFPFIIPFSLTLESPPSLILIGQKLPPSALLWKYSVVIQKKAKICAWTMIPQCFQLLPPNTERMYAYSFMY